MKRRKTPVFSKRMGRPFRGNVSRADGKEDMVLEKRSIFRAFKKFFGKDHYQSNKEIMKILSKLSNDEKLQIEEMIIKFANCPSK